MITSEGVIHTDNLRATNGQFTGVVEGSNIRGSTITGSAIQASYIAADVRMLTLSWANQEQYGTMSVEELENRGITPYMGFNVAVVGNDSVSGGSANLSYLSIRSYDYANKSDYFRYTRNLITPSFTGTGITYYYSWREYRSIGPRVSSALNVRVEIYHDGTKVKTFETGSMVDGQVISNAEYECRAQLQGRTWKTGEGHSNNGNWISYAREFKGTFAITMKKHTYNGSRSRIGARAYVYHNSRKQWLYAATFSIADTALNDYTPSNQGPK